MEYFKEIEMLLYIQGEKGLSSSDLKQILNISTLDARRLLKEFLKNWNKNEHGIIVNNFNDVFKFSTKPEYNDLISKWVTIEKKHKLSQASLETIGIIAYKQPITKSEINKIRGVISDGTVSTLLVKGIIEEKGVLDKIGKPILYGVTNKFYDYFKLTSLKELPQMNDLDIPMDEKTDESFDLFSSQREKSNIELENEEKESTMNNTSNDDDESINNSNLQNEIIDDQTSEEIIDDQTSEEEIIDDQTSEEEIIDDQTSEKTIDSNDNSDQKNDEFDFTSLQDLPPNDQTSEEEIIDSNDNSDQKNDEFDFTLLQDLPSDD